MNENYIFFGVLLYIMSFVRDEQYYYGGRFKDQKLIREQLTNRRLGTPRMTENGVINAIKTEYRNVRNTPEFNKMYPRNMPQEPPLKDIVSLNILNNNNLSEAEKYKISQLYKSKGEKLFDLHKHYGQYNKTYQNLSHLPFEETKNLYRELEKKDRIFLYEDEKDMYSGRQENQEEEQLNQDLHNHTRKFYINDSYERLNYREKRGRPSTASSQERNSESGSVNEREVIIAKNSPIPISLMQTRSHSANNTTRGGSSHNTPLRTSEKDNKKGNNKKKGNGR